jgi:hypothetical protein
MIPLLAALTAAAISTVMLVPQKPLAPATSNPGISTAIQDPTLLPGFHRSPYFGEQTCEEWFTPGIRTILNAPTALDPAKPNRLIIFATPNGNTIEQTLGTALSDNGISGKTDWHFDIQHIAAQVRCLREIDKRENIVLACVEAEGLSWPAWRAKHTDNAAIIRLFVESLRGRFASPTGGLPRVILTGHSGGGSFTFGFINAAPVIPDWVERIGFLDSNYSYSDDPADHHGDKLLTWLRNDSVRADSPSAHRLIVIAYDDRNITFDGKPVVGPTGGTYRATGRMTDRFAKEIALTEGKAGPFESKIGLKGQAQFFVHSNPENKILHTVLVGEMNGLLEAMTAGTPEEKIWGTFGAPGRTYQKWVTPAWDIPPRPADAPGGSVFMKSVATLSSPEREEKIAAELLRGNLPEFQRKFVPVTVQSTDAQNKNHSATYEVMPDYLAIGSDTDWVRVPMTPMTAQRLADAWGCLLSTRKISDDVYKAATVKLEPHPMTEARESVTTFLQYNDIVEAQRKAAGKTLGSLVAGNKKDVVITNRLDEKPHRIAIYGWHKRDGQAIQPLYIGHVDWYVDYSHGIRLIKRAVTVDGRVRDAHLVAHDPDLASLFSDEGPLLRPSY